MRNHLLFKTIAAVVLVGCGPSVDIHKAAVEGNISIIKQYLDDGRDVDANDSFDRTPLDRAAVFGQKEVAKLLIANGADVNAKGDKGKTPLHGAVMFDRKEMVELLISAGADVSNADFHEAVIRGHMEIAKLLIAKGADVNAKDDEGETPLLRAIRFASFTTNQKRHKETIELIVNNGADVNIGCDKGKTPLIAAIHGSFYEYIKGGNGKDKVKRLNGKDTVKLLIENGADVNVGNVNSLGLGETPLHIAALAGKSEIIEFLIKAEADVNAKNSLGTTPMDSAMLHPKITDLLRKHGGKTQYELEAATKPNASQEQ